jgi:hypothetical protein
MFAATFVAASANAQDTTVSTGEIAAQPTVESFVVAIDATPATIEKLNALESLSSENITLVDVHTLAMSDSAAVSSAIERNKEQTEQLRTSISANPAIGQALSSHTPPLQPSDVVAAEVTADNKVIVYFKREESKPMESGQPPK